MRIAFVILLLLSGCSPKIPSFRYITQKARKYQLQRIKDFNVYGRLIIQNKQKEVIKFQWIQKNGNYVIYVYSLFNIVAFKIEGDKNRATLFESETKKQVAKNVEELMLENIGWYLPLSFFRYWILTLPVPNISYRAKFDKYNHLIFLKQKGWIIKYSDFKTVKNVDLPRKILISYHNFKFDLSISSLSF